MTYGLENRCSIQLSYGCISSRSAKDRASVVLQQIIPEKNCYFTDLKAENLFQASFPGSFLHVT
jgi:hypothetical protein